MKKLLLITYHWPPMGGGGVQRWLKMSKYLRHYGWEPVIFTVSDAEISLPDESLLREVPEGTETIRTPIWEPFGLYKKITGKKGDEKVQPGFLNEGEGGSWQQELAYWIRGNVFIPDAKRFWIRPAVKSLLKYLKNHKVDALVSTGPPHTTHIIALQAKAKTGLPWLADFRDPWTFVDYYDKLRLSKWADKKHHQLEKKVIDTADQTITVTPSWAADFNRRDFAKKVEVVTNGYDPADFLDQEKVALHSQFTLTHIGSMNADRNPHHLWPQLAKIISENEDFAKSFMLRLIGPVDYSVLAAIKKYDLKDHVQHTKNMPHVEVIPELQRSALLLLPLNDTPNIDGVVPGKLFEYIGARRPILCIGKPTGDAANIIRECSAGTVFDFTVKEELGSYIMEQYQRFKAGKLQVESSNFRHYGRDKLAGAIGRYLDKIT